MKTKPVAIKCSLRPIELKFVGLPICRKRGKYFQLSVSGSEFKRQSFEISSQICADNPESGLVEFFEELAANHLVCEDLRHWESPEWGLSFASWIDTDVRLVELGVAFWTGKGVVEEKIGRSLTGLEWLDIVKGRVEQKALFVAASQLEEIAASIREFFNTLEEAEEAAEELELVERLEMHEGNDDI